MKFLLPLLLLATTALAGNQSNRNSAAISTDGFKAEQNLVKNSGFEYGTRNFTASGGTYTTTTTAANLGRGNRSGSFDASAASQTLTSDAVAIPAGLYSSNCEASVKYKGGDSNLKFQVYDGTNVVAEQTLSASTAYTTAYVTFVCPSSGNLQARLISSADAAIVYLDDFYIGENTKAFNYSTAQFVGSIKYGNSGCNWQGTASTYSDFAADSDCTSAGVTTNGNASIAATAIPAIKITNVSAGHYYIVARGRFVKDNTASNGFHYFRFSNGTVNSGSNIVGTSASATLTTPNIDGYLDLPSGTHTISIQYREPTGVQTGIPATDSNETLEISVYKFPTASEIAVRSDNGDTDWQQYTLNIGATTTAPTKGTTAVDKAMWRRVGDSMEIRYDFRQTTAGTAGSGTYLFPLPSGYTIDTNKLTPSTTGLSGLCGTSIVSTGASLTNPSTYHGNAVAYNSSNIALTFGYNTTSLGFVTSGGMELANNPQGYQFICKVPIQGWTKTMSAPILVGSVTSNDQANAYRVETLVFGGNAAGSTACSSSPCTISAQSGSWVSSVTRNATGDYTINIPSGTFKTKPICTCSSSTLSGYLACVPRYDTSSTTAFNVQILSAGAGGGITGDGVASVQCMGIKGP